MVRSMFDLAVAAERRDSGLSEAEVRAKIERDLLGHLQSVGISRVFLVTAWYPT